MIVVARLQQAGGGSSSPDRQLLFVGMAALQASARPTYSAPRQCRQMQGPHAGGGPTDTSWEITSNRFSHQVILPCGSVPAPPAWQAPGLAPPPRKAAAVPAGSTPRMWPHTCPARLRQGEAGTAGAQ